jgi:DNA-binding transcriptional ArsR family regulator
MQIAPPDFDRTFGALADQTRRDIVRRAIDAEEGVVELASHYPMSFAAVQKHVAVLERAGLVTKERIGRRKVVRTNVEALRVTRRLLDQYEELWRDRIASPCHLASAHPESPDVEGPPPSEPVEANDGIRSVGKAVVIPDPRRQL